MHSTKTHVIPVFIFQLPRAVIHIVKGFNDVTKIQEFRHMKECNMKFVDPCIIVVLTEKKMQQDATVYQNFIIPCFKWSSTCFRCHTTCHQEPKTSQAASGFAYVEGCWTLSGRVLHSISSPIAAAVWHIPLLYTQFWAPDDGRKNRPKHVERFTRINNLR
jgi:hypothetical protein